MMLIPFRQTAIKYYEKEIRKQIDISKQAQVAKLAQRHDYDMIFMSVLKKD